MSDTEQTVLEAVLSNRADRLRELLEMGADPNVGSLRLTPLCAAAELGYTACVELLLKAGADPNLAAPWPIRPLQLAAAQGHAAVVTALLEAGADPSLPDRLNRGLPQFLAHRFGHQEIARSIREHALKLKKQRAEQHLHDVGWNPVAAPDGVAVSFTGTQMRAPEAVFAAATAVELEPVPDPPFTTFDGWLKQLNDEKLDVMRREAVDAAFPLFVNLEIPEADFLPDRPPEGRTGAFVMPLRERRFAGDPHLPRARYFTVCDAEGRDYETLKYELLAYRYLPFSGKIQLVDCAEPDAGEQLDTFGMKPPASQCLVLVFMPGRDWLNPFLIKAGFPQRPVGQILPLKIEHVRIEKTIDLRLPATAEWFARFFSRLVQDISGHSTTRHKAMRSWPFRPPLENFKDILPAILTQEIGGNSLTSAIGAWLRKAGAGALVFPSARNDTYLVVDEQRPTDFGGWNLVDFRGAPPVREQVFLEVDDYWPSEIRLGPGRLLGHVPPNPFRFVSLAFTDAGRYAGSFQVEKMSSTVNTLIEMELEAIENGRPVRPWWSWANYVEDGR